jgi:subtilase family serine protease
MAVLFLMVQPIMAAEKQLPGHVPEAVKGLSPSGRLPATNVLDLAIGLPLRDQPGLDSLLRQIYDPGSPQFRQYVTPEEFTGRFGPSQEDYQAVLDFAHSNNLDVVKTSGNRVLLDVRGKVADIERAFGIHLLTYRHPTERREFFAPDAEPSVDSNLPIRDVSGLNNYALAHPMSLRPTPEGVTPAAGTGPSGNYIGADFRHAYAPSVTLTGTGQMVGLVELEGYYAADIASYEHLAGLPNTPLINVPLDGFSGPTSTDTNGISEASLDIEVAISMATGLTAVVVFEAPNSSAYWNDILTAMVSSNHIKQFSSSWGYPGGTNATSDTLYQEMAAQGQSFFQASGDGDAWTGAIEQPSDDPNVTSVGGTTLTMTGSGASYASETVWDWGYRPPAWSGNGNGYWGSGGGVSTYYSIPSWQQGINMQTNKGSTTMRNIPDVALTANQIWVIYHNGLSNSFGGTSCAAPLWAGFLALVNQQAAQSGRPTVGFLNPSIYALGKGASYSSSLHDITAGNNTNSSSANLYFACPGYDLCTGWGTPSGQNLITALATPDALGVLPGSGFTTTGTFGGPFSTNAEAFSLTNSSSSALTWSAIVSGAWLNVAPLGGTLGASAGTSVSVGLNSLASNLPPGAYSGTVTFSNTTSKVAQPRQFTLAVSPLQLVQNGGFEDDTNFTDWTLSGNYEPYTEVSGATYVNDDPDPTYPHSGTNMAFLNAQGVQASIAQTLATTRGQTYVLSFWVNGTDGSTPNLINALWNGNIMLGVTNLAAGWVQGLGFVVATGATSTVQFNFEDDSSWIALDDVSVEPVAPPFFQPVARTNSTLDLQWYAMTGLLYQVQYRTNLSQGAWVNLGSPISATNLLLTATDTIGPGRQRFYRVVVSP